LKKQIIKVVDNQIKANDPPCTKKTFIQLQEQGCSKAEAKEMIAEVLLEDIYDILSDGKNFDEKNYELKLKELVEDDFIFDDIGQALADEKDEILQAKHRVYDALYEHKPTEAVRQFMSAWDKIKKFIVDEYDVIDAGGIAVKPELIDIDDKTEFRYELYNWLQDMEMAFSNTRMFQERIQFCKDVIELFAWQEDSADDYRTSIGEALNDLQNYEECDDWFEAWLKEEPDNPNCINIYLLCLINRGDMEKAKMIAKQYIKDDIPCTMENEIMFIRAIELYETLGDSEKVLELQTKIDESENEFYNTQNDDFSYDETLYFNEPIVKGKKIYPNEPCPCGSGKKYKKCCGKEKN
jgi:tetratricopeptide (TPR) repeat protein